MYTYGWRSLVIGSIASVPRFLTVRQAATLLEVDVDTMWCWIETGEVPSELLPGGSRRIARAVLVDSLVGGHELARELAKLESSARP